MGLYRLSATVFKILLLDLLINSVGNVIYLSLSVFCLLKSGT